MNQRLKDTRGGAKGDEEKNRKKATAEGCQWAIAGSVSPADIVSMPLTSKGPGLWGESGGLQTMGGEENNIKVSRTFESGIIPKQLFCMHAALDQISLSFSPSRSLSLSLLPAPPSTISRPVLPFLARI